VTIVTIPFICFCIYYFVVEIIRHRDLSILLYRSSDRISYWGQSSNSSNRPSRRGDRDENCSLYDNW